MEKNKKKLFESVIILVVLAVFIFTVCITIIFGWFTTSNTPTNELSVNIKGDININIEFSTDGENWDNAEQIILQNFFAGQANKKTLFLRITHNDIKDININLSFHSPNGIYGNEIPYIESGLYYYLGSQLQISDVRANVNGQGIDISQNAVGKGKYLVETTSEGVTKGQATGISDAVLSIPALNIIENFLLSAGTVTLFEIDFTFVDNGENQNIYKNSSNYVCSRRLMLRWEDV